MIREGLQHTQKVYKKVHEFTSLVKSDVQMETQTLHITDVLKRYLSNISYANQVEISDNLPELDINETLFCTAIDNLIKNGLKYNNSSEKLVKIYQEDNMYITIEDNGVGLSDTDFKRLSRSKQQKESGSGLGLNICTAILLEHGFSVTSEQITQGTKIKIKIT